MSKSKTPAPLCVPLTLGVPQCSVLGSVPFLLYINDMIDPQTRCALFILLTIQEFLHPTATLTMAMPQ